MPFSFILKRAIEIHVPCMVRKECLGCECENTDGLRVTCIQMAYTVNLVRGERVMLTWQ